MRLLGSMLTTRIFLGAMSRADLPAHELAKAPNFYFYVDEFQNFANESFSEILSEARKYHLNLLIAHQYVAQMEEEVQAAVFGNVGTTVSFRVGPLDAELLEKVFMPEFLQEDLVNLGFAQIYLSLMIDGIGSRPFSAVTIPPIEAPARSMRAEVLANSRAQFATKRAGVEGAIFTELSQAAEEAAANHKAASAGVSKSQYDAKRIAEGRGDYRQQNGGNGSAPRRAEGRPQPAREPRPEPRERSPDAPRELRRDGPPHERPPAQRTAPAAAEKTAADLKSILRATIANAEKDKGKAQASRQESLKGAVQGAVKDAPQREARESRGQQPPRERSGERPVPPAPRQDPPRAPKEPSLPAPDAAFEVPEDALRALFKDT